MRDSNKRVGEWLARNKWYIAGAIALLFFIVYMTDRFAG